MWGGETFTLSSLVCLAPVGIVAVLRGGSPGPNPFPNPFPFPARWQSSALSTESTAASRSGRAPLTPFHCYLLRLSATTTIKTLIKAHAFISEATPNELLILLITFQSRNRGSRRRRRRRQLWQAEHKGAIVRRCFGGKVLIREEIIDFHGTYRDGEEILGNHQNPIYIHIYTYTHVHKYICIFPPQG